MYTNQTLTSGGYQLKGTEVGKKRHDEVAYGRVDPERCSPRQGSS